MHHASPTQPRKCPQPTIPAEPRALPRLELASHPLRLVGWVWVLPLRSLTAPRLRGFHKRARRQVPTELRQRTTMLLRWLLLPVLLQSLAGVVLVSHMGDV